MLSNGEASIDANSADQPRPPDRNTVFDLPLNCDREVVANWLRMQTMIGQTLVSSLGVSMDEAVAAPPSDKAQELAAAPSRTKRLRPNDNSIRCTTCSTYRSPSEFEPGDFQIICVDSLSLRHHLLAIQSY